MKVQIVRPWSAIGTVGDKESHYGVDFIVVSSGPKESVLVADLPDADAHAMIDAGRATEVVTEVVAEKAKK